jgi:hypothetical protein
MARKAGQIISRGQSTWLFRVYLGRDQQTKTRKYHDQTILGSFREAQRFLSSSGSNCSNAIAAGVLARPL